MVLADRDAAVARALVEEACRKSALVWLRPSGAVRAQAAWHVWVDDAVHLVSGGLEQPLPELPDGVEVDVTARSKDNGSRVVTFRATVSTVAPDCEGWERAVTELHAKRLNPPDGEEQPAHWPPRPPPPAPPAAPATTRGKLPFVAGRRARRRP